MRCVRECVRRGSGRGAVQICNLLSSSRCGVGEGVLGYRDQVTVVNCGGRGLYLEGGIK